MRKHLALPLTRSLTLTLSLTGSLGLPSSLLLLVRLEPLPLLLMLFLKRVCLMREKQRRTTPAAGWRR